VDQIELGSVFERFGDVKIFGYFGIDTGILFIPPIHHGMQTRTRKRIPTGEQSYIPATSH
jgi:hypothetical protein